MVILSLFLLFPTLCWLFPTPNSPLNPSFPHLPEDAKSVFSLTACLNYSVALSPPQQWFLRRRRTCLTPSPAFLRTLLMLSDRHWAIEGNVFRRWIPGTIKKDGAAAEGMELRPHHVAYKDLQGLWPPLASPAFARCAAAALNYVPCLWG